MEAKSRMNKWKKYREEIDSNENIYISLINSNSELKSQLESINFDIERLIKENDDNRQKNIDLSDNKNKVINKINSILSLIEQSDNNLNNKSLGQRDFDSHINDKIIDEHFSEFKNQNEVYSETETTDLKINKINIINSEEN